MGKIQQSLNWNGPRMAKVQDKITHEEYIKEVALIGSGRLNDDDGVNVAGAKLTYGAGAKGLRGVTYFNRWLKDGEKQTAFVEICSFGEENPVQLAGTTLHELGHVLAGHEAGHSKDWKLACGKLGLRRIQAAGTSYSMAMFEPDIRARVWALIQRLEYSRPANGAQGFPHAVPKPCSMGVGTRGGTSRGVGSGSRLRKYVCACEVPQIIRASTDSLEAVHVPCMSKFKLSS